jgi:uncharacterized protein YyaL (SSP411 family)
MSPGQQREIEWLDWSDEAFDGARQDDKLLLVDSGATWCHWCHVMDHQTYEDPEVVALINDRFVPVRIDRDRMPDIDARLQRTPALVSPQGSAGGWPLTVLLTPQRQMLFKATFLPPRSDPRYGPAVGMVDLLPRIDDYWRAHRDEVDAAGEHMAQSLASEYQKLYQRPEELSERPVREIVSGLHQAYDDRHGGFGGAPKFFNAAGLELLLANAWDGNERSREMVTGTLERIARGGVHDQLAGGFHRYAVDAEWHVPHFEKMAYDNAALLALFANAASLTGRADFARVAESALGWIAHTLTDEGGGFYASQDADVGADDDGDYFTWTVAEVRAALGELADRAIALYDITAEGDMSDRPGRNVLHLPRRPNELAGELGLATETVAQELEQARWKLLEERRRRPRPAVDRTLFADLNGMMIDAHLTVWERLSIDAARDTAESALERMLSTCRDGRGVFGHWADQHGLHRPGMLADQAWMLRAILHAFAVAPSSRLMSAARAVADYVLSDMLAEDGAPLALPRDQSHDQPGMRNWEDAPVRSAASVTAEALADLGRLTDDERYSNAARRALASFAGAVGSDWATFLGGYALAARKVLAGPTFVTIIGESEAATALEAAARRPYVPGAWVLAAGADVDELDLLPPDAERPAAPAALVCRGTSCLPPAHTATDVGRRLDELRDARAV